MGRRRSGMWEAALCGLLVGALVTGRAWAQAPRGAEAGLAALAEGQEAFEALDMERALAQLERARLLLSGPGHAPLRSRAWALKIAAQWAQGDVEGARQEARRLLAVDPAVHFSPDHFSPEALAQLERLREDARAAIVRTAGEARLPLPLGEGRGEGLRPGRPQSRAGSAPSSACSTSAARPSRPTPKRAREQASSCQA
jgi:tetratricopeptide (TPR) repeat protein